MRRTLTITMLFLLFAGTAKAYPTGKLTIKAVDDHGSAIRGAQVRASFSVPNNSGIGLASINSEDTTNEKGLCVLSGETMGLMGFSVDKKGYYQSSVGYEFKSRSRLLNRWEPWNPTVEVVLKKKRNPVPMFRKGTHGMNIPAFDKPVGFDLEKGDWVAPYGAGVISDFVFLMFSNDRAYTDYECGFTLTFSNEHDGIQEYYFDQSDQSYYKWPFISPVDGYKKKLIKEKSISLPGKGYSSNEKNDVNYLFRVRTKVDKNGNILEARYGKLRGEFEFDPKGAIKFGYSFNPDGTRNLEHDPDKNLFGTGRRRR